MVKTFRSHFRFLNEVPDKTNTTTQEKWKDTLSLEYSTRSSLGLTHLEAVSETKGSEQKKMKVDVDFFDGSAAPTRHKPILQARRNQFADYRQLRDRDFQSVHEELTHLRSSARDLEKIIALLKAEKNRLSAELLNRGKELEHLQNLVQSNILKKPTSTEDLTLVDDLRRQIAVRDSEIAELRTIKVEDEVHEAVTNGNAVRVDERAGELHSELVLMREQMEGLHEALGHKEDEIRRLNEGIQQLNEEMVERTRRMQLEVAEAANMGKIDAKSEITSLRDEIETWKRRTQEANDVAKLKEAEEARAKEQLHLHQKAANDEVAERTKLVSEVRRLELLVREVDSLRMQIDQFRENQASSDEVLRERISTADLEIHELKGTQRQLLLELENMKDAVASKERELLQVRREAEKKVAEARHDPGNEFTQQLTAAKDEAGSTKATLAATTEKLVSASATITHLNELIKMHEADKVNRAATINTVEASLAEVRSELSQKKSELASIYQQLDEARIRERQLMQEKSAHEVNNSEAAHIIESLESRIHELQHAIETDFAEQHEGILLELNQWKTQCSTLEADSRREMDEVREVVEMQVSILRQQLLTANADLDTEKRTTAQLHSALETMENEAKQHLLTAAEHFNGLLLEAQQTEASLRDSLRSAKEAKEGADAAASVEVQALRKEIDEKNARLEKLEAEAKIAAEASQKFADDAKISDADMSKLKQQVAALATEKETFAKKRAVWTLEKEALVDKIKNLEASLKDVERSLASRDEMLRQQIESKQSAAKAEQEVVEAMKKEHVTEVAKLQDDLRQRDEELKDYRARVPTAYEMSLKQRVKELQDENNRLKTVQMTW